TAGIAVIIIALFLISAVLDGFAYYILAKVGQTIIMRLRELVWDKFLKLPVKYFDATKSGEAVSRLVNDTASIKHLITSHVTQDISAPLSSAGSVDIVFILDWKMSLLMLISVPISIVIMLPHG